MNNCTNFLKNSCDNSTKFVQLLMTYKNGNIHIEELDY